MDPISGLFVLLILIAFAYGLYLAYQKFVVDGGLFQTPEETTVQTTTPVVTAPAGEVPGVNSVKGRPAGGAVNMGNTIGYYGGSEKLIGDGRAKTASACYEASKARGINNWGWDRQTKSCYAYVDSNILSAMSDPLKVENTSRYITGCTEPGVSPTQGCLNWINGNIAKGWNDVANTNKTQNVSLEQCREIIRDEGFDSFLYMTNRYTGSLGSDSSRCAAVTDSQKHLGFTGSNSDISHILGCVDPSKKIKDGCM